MIRAATIVCYLLLMVSAGAQTMNGPMVPGSGGPMIPTGGSSGGGGSTAPVVTAVTPPFGILAGGTSVVINGNNFTGVTAVAFGATPAASFTFVSANAINATSPAGTGTVNVTVTTPIGTSGISPADHFTYTASCSNSLDFSQACNSQYLPAVF